MMMNPYHKVGDRIYLDSAEFLSSPKNPTRHHGNFKEGDVVCTKYGPRYTCEVLAVRFKGLQVKILEIDETKQGYYQEWPEYKAVIERDDLTDEEKFEELLWKLNT